LIIEEAKAGATIVLNKIYFETGKATVNTSSSSDLNKLVQFLKDNPLVKLEIQGHTDNTCTLNANTKLSQLRANSIVNYLVKNGVGKERLLAKGYGPSIPIADNITTEGKAQNRRVEMKVLE
jgi:outer membrane protein OmpA-like peptidoglycan-associated protein